MFYFLIFAQGNWLYSSTQLMAKMKTAQLKARLKKSASQNEHLKED